MELLKKNKIATGALCILAIAGLCAYVFQLMGGLGVTGMNNGTSWGLYITMFMLFVGLSAGGLIVASSASVFHIEKFKKVALPAVVLSTVCICVAGLFVLIDLGGVYRIWRIFTGPNFMSPLLWDVCVIVCYLIINILYLYFMCSRKADPKKVAVISRFALPIAILVHSVTAWIFGLQISREGWYSAIMAPIFVASAMDSGLALLLISLVALEKAKLIKLGRDLMASLAGLLATCIAVDAFFIGCEVLTVAYPQTAGGAQLLGEMFSGATAPFFWFEVAAGLIVPFCKRIWLLFTSFIHPNMAGAPGISSGSSVAAHSSGIDIWSTAGSYAPTPVEILVVLGVISLASLVYLALVSKLIEGGKVAVSTAAASEAQAS